MREPNTPTAAELALLDPDGSFIRRLAEDQAVLAALGAGPFDDGALAGIQLLAHRLAGAAGTFGHAAVGAAALDLEEGVIDLRDGRGTSAAISRRLAVLLAALDAALRLK